jgi:hypothetical protein
MRLQKAVVIEHVPRWEVPRYKCATKISMKQQPGFVVHIWQQQPGNNSLWCGSMMVFTMVLQ